MSLSTVTKPHRKNRVVTIASALVLVEVGPATVVVRLGVVTAIASMYAMLGGEASPPPSRALPTSTAVTGHVFPCFASPWDIGEHEAVSDCRSPQGHRYDRSINSPHCPALCTRCRARRHGAHARRNQPIRHGRVDSEGERRHSLAAGHAGRRAAGFDR